MYIMPNIWHIYMYTHHLYKVHIAFYCVEMFLWTHIIYIWFWLKGILTRYKKPSTVLIQAPLRFLMQKMPTPSPPSSLEFWGCLFRGVYHNQRKLHDKIGPLKLTGRYCPLVMHGEIQLFRVVSSDYGKLCFRGCSKSENPQGIFEAFLGGCFFFRQVAKTRRTM